MKEGDFLFGPSYCRIHDKDLSYIYFWKPTQENGIFSQWAYTPFSDKQYIYSCAEQYMMSQKARLFDDAEIFKQIMDENNPSKMKSLGQKVRNFDESVWDEEKYGIVVRASYLKFANASYKNLLIETGSDILVEASPYDTIWGVGVNAQQASDIRNWKGQNLLGQALMEARKMIIDK